MPGGGGKGGSEPQQTTQTVTPTFFPGQMELTSAIFPKVQEQFLDNQDRFKFPQQTVAGFDPNQIAAQNLARQFALTQGPQFQANILGAQDFGLNTVLDPFANPALTGAMDAAIRPIEQALTQRILPGIRSNAVGAGQYGSSRQGIAEGLALQDFNRTAADVTSQLAFSGFQEGLDTFEKTLGLTPQIQQGALFPANVLGQVGGQSRAMEQALINEDISRLMFEQFLPLQLTGDAASIAFGAPTAGSTSTGVSPGAQQPGIASQMAGGALMGGQMAGAFGFDPIIGGIGGAILGGFGLF